jgi:PAS domain S-box-containing protein
VPLTQAENQWLADHPVIRIGGEANWPPYDFVDEQANHAGVAADILKAIGDRLGVHFEVDTSLPWETMLNQVRSGKLFAVCAIAPTPSRKKDFIFTTPYALSPSGVVTHPDNTTIKSLSDLANKRVAIPAGFADIELLRARLPNFKHVKVNSLLEALKAVQNKQADAFFGSVEVAAYLMDHNQLSNLQVVIRDVPLRGNELRIGITNSQPLLASILQKGLRSLSLEETNVILNRWVTNLDLSLASKMRVVLTVAEQTWLASHPVVRFTGDPNWLPFEAFNEQGEYIGIVADVLDLIETRTGINFERIPSGTWLKAMQMANNSQVDVLSDDIGNKAVKDSLHFTKPYLEFPMAIVMQDSQKEFISDLHEIANKRVAIIEGYGYIWELFKKYPDINFVEVANIQEALLGVSTGSIDAFLASFNLSSYHINQMGLNNLRIVGQVPVTVKIGLGVRKDMPELHGILNKAIATLNEAEKFRIAESWMQNKYIEANDYTLLKRVLLGSTLLLFFFLLWNRLLNNQVQKHTASLHKSQESLSKAQRIAHLGNWEWDFASDAVIWSDEVFRLFGYQPQAIQPTGKFFAQHLHPDDRDILSKAVNDTRAGKQSINIAFRIVRKDNNIRYVDVQVEPITRYQKMTGLFGTIQDKTEQQHAELALRQSEKRYRRFVETNTAGILNVEYRPPIPIDLPAEKQLKLFIENSYTIEVNTVLAKQLGYSSPEECQGKNLSFHIDASIPENIKNMLSYIKTGYKASGVLLHARDLQGNKKYFLNNAQGVVEGDFLKGTWLSLVDVSNRLKSELALQTSEEKFSKAFDSSPDPMCITKLRDARFQYINKSFEKISGYRKDEVLGHTPHELNLWDDSREGEKMRDLLKAHAEIRELDMTLFTRSGDKRLTQISGGVFHFEDEPYLVLEIRDLTEKIGLEKKTQLQELQLIQANKMTALGTLLSGVGHEINNPNNLMMMNSQILQDAWPEIAKAMEQYNQNNPAWQLADLPFEEMKDALPELIADIKDGTQRIQNIVGTLRNFARPGQTDEQEEYQANDAVQHALPLLKHLIQRNTNHFHLQLADELPFLNGNSQKIEQVIINLVINALESLPNRESSVTLSSRYKSTVKMIEIEVADEGTGMSEDQLKKIREPFFSTKLDTGGTGLGLAISESLINEQGGYLSFCSIQGKGTQAVIHLPVAI